MRVAGFAAGDISKQDTSADIAMEVNRLHDYEMH